MSGEVPRKVLLVTGSRSIKNANVVNSVLNSVVDSLQPTVLLHGGATGVDRLAGKWAAARGLLVEVKRPDFTTWPIRQFKWKAYAMRDLAMVNEADVVVAIWDGHSSGTRITKDAAEKQHKLHLCWTPAAVIKY